MDLLTHIDETRQIVLPYELALDLLESKIRSLRQEIERLLDKWGQHDVETFQTSTRQGKNPEAETDAIVIGNLSEKLQEYESLLETL